jgi:hypothetical protein
LYPSKTIIKGKQIKEDEMGGEMRNTYKITIGKPEWKSPLGKSRRR